jgi:hypothetical protein
MERNSLPWTLCIATLTKMFIDDGARRPIEARLRDSEDQAYDLWPPDFVGDL